MRRPARAERTCSASVTPVSGGPSVVRRCVPVTQSARAGTITAPGQSVRWNTMPVSGGAGWKRATTREPVMNPVPATAIGRARVRWCRYR